MNYCFAEKKDRNSEGQAGSLASRAWRQKCVPKLDGLLPKSVYDPSSTVNADFCR